MAKKDNMAMLGKYAFIIGLVLAIIAGVVPAIAGYAYLSLIMVILGLIVGFLNISEKDSSALLLGIVALSLVGTAAVSVIPAISANLETMLNNFVAFVGAAGLVVALKTILQVSRRV